ncbi:MAG: inosine/xanthosine triphosphatase [Chloroflexi bacterium]|nr:inosine/xanthosine triphosphatase [Chloroflexota bacterium]
MKIAVGSTNPVKVEAARLIVGRVWDDVEVVSVSVPSGISEMPMSDEETQRGAVNRAHMARKQAGADLGIGLEGGVHLEPFGLTLMGWAAIVDGNGRQSLAGAARLPLPEHIARRVLAGEELGDVMDDILNDRNIKQKGGAVGALTAGLIPRGQAFAQAVAYALSPFIAPELHNLPEAD